MIDWKARAQDVLLIGTIALFMSIIEPYGAGAGMVFPLKIAIWFLLVSTGAVAGELTSIAMCANGRQPPVWQVIGLTSLTSAAAVTCVIILLVTFVSGMPEFPHWPILYLSVLVISIGVASVSVLVSRVMETNAESSSAETGKDGTARFIDRLPPRYRTADLYAIASEDHYLRAYTNLGEELILMRLADAVRELEGSGGLQVHRSWWVAADAVDEIVRRDGRVLLKLRNGKEVPVSRSFRDASRKAGLPV